MKDLFSLEGRVALITGGSRGIGRMIAEGFLAYGAKIYITARKEAPLRQAAAELSAHGSCTAIPVDVSSAEGIARLAEAFGAQEERLDILVNNAGAAWLAPFDEFPEAGWDKVVDLNLKAPFFLTQALLPKLRAAASQARPAKVIHVASIDGISVNPMETYPYGASKAGLIHLTRRMALKLAPENIVVSAIAPGPFPSDMNRVARDQTEMVAAQVPAGRVGRAEDMAGVAIYLASRAGDYVVGSTVTVDGGVTHARG